MSLLLNLLNNSSSTQRELQFLSPRQDDRSRSTLHVDIKNDFKKPSKSASKSLSKLGFAQIQPSIDPKTRILHRISHILSMKYRKHFYSLFVTLQTIKKKQLYLQRDGEFGLQNPLQAKKKFSENDISSITSKISQVYHINLVKYFQTNIKQEFFQQLKINAAYKDKINKLQFKINIFINNANKKYIFKKLKALNQLVFKIQMLTTFIQRLVDKYQPSKTQKRQLLIQALKHIKNQGQIMNQINTIKKNQQNIYLTPKKIQSFIQDLNQTVKFERQYSSQGQFKEPDTQEQHNELHKQVKQNELHKQVQLIEQYKQGQLNDHYKQNILNDNYKSQRKQLIESQAIRYASKNIRPSSRVRPFIYSIPKTTCFSAQQLNPSSMLQCVKIYSHLQQEPLKSQEYQSNFISQGPTLQCNKIAINTICNNLNEQCDQNIFNFQTRTNRFKQSKVKEYISKNRNLFRNIEDNIKTTDIKHQIMDLSQVSSISYLKSDRSANTLINDYNKMNFSVFGGQAVNFKNSLVKERESLKNSAPKFIKKQNPQLQILQNKSMVTPTFYMKHQNSYPIISTPYQSQGQLYRYPTGLSGYSHQQQIITPTKDSINNSVNTSRDKHQKTLVIINGKQAREDSFQHKNKGFIKIFSKK